MILSMRVTGDRGTHSLFQESEGGSTPTVTLISCNDAARMVEAWHYSKRMPTGKNICFGWWIGEELYAAAVYGIGVNPYQSEFVRTMFGWTFADRELLELKRCVRIEPAVGSAPLTKFLSLCHRWLAKNGYKVIVAFSDPEAGHVGTLYRAGGWIDAGQTNAEWHLVESDGTRRHRRFAFRYARRNDVSISDARNALGCTRVKTAPKRRFVIPIAKGLPCSASS